MNAVTDFLLHFPDLYKSLINRFIPNDKFLGSRQVLAAENGSPESLKWLILLSLYLVDRHWK